MPTDTESFIVSARNLAEYKAFFDLTDDDLAGWILDCPGGAASFTADVTALGGQVAAVDPIYALPTAELHSVATDHAARASSFSRAHYDQYDWAWYETPERHARIRREAAAAFVADHTRHPERYVAAQLPELPFADDAFDLALCSHLLFTYRQITLEQHIAAIRELTRVAAEARVFPLVDITGGRADALMESISAQLAREGLDVRIVDVPFRFQKHATQMLVATRHPRPVRSEAATIELADALAREPELMVFRGARAVTIDDVNDLLTDDDVARYQEAGGG